jgi:asparagine synthase (glutamine-hydrolysing)
LKDLHHFDVLRCDKSSAGAGLEIRVSLLDKEFLDYYMSLDPSLKIPDGQIEKRLLRLTFQDLLPAKITWRVKEGMSDGVSSVKKSWHSIIQDKVGVHYTGSELRDAQNRFNPPMTKEALYYRELFNKYYKGRDDILPFYWLPRWSGDIVEPSARILNVYKK